MAHIAQPMGIYGIIHNGKEFNDYLARAVQFYLIG
jgi:hypothetical protein